MSNTQNEAFENAVKTMIQKIEYIHNNPVKRGYIDEARHWRYSSARDYDDKKGLLDIEKMF